MPEFKQIPQPLLRQLTDVRHERNMYVHPNIIARGIFWQRLRCGYGLIERQAPTTARALDFGGGSGVFLPSLAARFLSVSVIDTDLEDARRIVTHYRLGNVRFIEHDISTWMGSETFDVIVAMDVLEHFADMTTPLAFLEKHLAPAGLLLVSLPTENILYRLGRLVLRKQKPHDHYHSARSLIRYYCENGYRLLAANHVPRFGGIALPLFFVGILQKHE